MSAMVRSRSRGSHRDDRASSDQDARRSASRSQSRHSTSLDRARGRSGSREGSERGRSSYSRSHSRSRSRSQSSNVPCSAKIVVEKLTKNIHESHLREVFGLHGEIQEMEIPENTQFMTNRGIAYILYTHPKYAERAIANLHEAQLDGALISVSIVLPRRRLDRSPPPMRPPPARFGEPHRFTDPQRGSHLSRGQGRGHPPRRSPPGYRQGNRRSPPPPRRYGRGSTYRDRHDDRGPYRPRSYSRSVSRSSRRERSSRYVSRSRSPSYTPPSRRGGRSPPRGGGRRDRSPSYSDYTGRSRSRERGDRGWDRR